MSPSATAFLAALGALLTLAIAVGVYIHLQGSWTSAVTEWHLGSDAVIGETTNGTGQGCTAAEVTLRLYDHNDAEVRDFSFGLGGMAPGEHRRWTTHMVGLLGIPAPVEVTVVRITAEATCTDRH